MNKHGRKTVEKAEPRSIFLYSFSSKTRIFFSCWGLLKAVGGALLRWRAERGGGKYLYLSGGEAALRSAVWNLWLVWRSLLLQLGLFFRLEGGKKGLREMASVGFPEEES